MKTQYNKAIGVALLLGAVGVVNAQEDLTKKNALEREMTLEREYDPTVLDANKVNTLPAIKEPEARKIPIDYSDYTIPASPAPQIGILPAGNMMTEIAHNKRRGYGEGQVECLVFTSFDQRECLLFTAGRREGQGED